MSATGRSKMVAGRQGKKKQKMTQILEYLRSNRVEPPIFDNDLVKRITGSEFGNQFDLTKFASSAKLPTALRENDCFPIHLGEGRHQIVWGISNGYHIFEPILGGAIRDWEYARSPLDGSDSSEAGALSLAFNQQILVHFLFGDRTIVPKIHLPRRTKHSFEYRMRDQLISATNLQIETDLTIEHRGTLAIFEAKNDDQDDMSDFAVYQLYHPYRYYVDRAHDGELQGIKVVRTVYVKKVVSAVRLYEYSFPKKQEPTSIELFKAAEYRLTEASGLDRY